MNIDTIKKLKKFYYKIDGCCNINFILKTYSFIFI